MLFTCSHCGGTFRTECTDAETLAEAEAAFPGHVIATSDPICDLCYRDFLRWLRRYDPAAYRQARAAARQVGRVN